MGSSPPLNVLVPQSDHPRTLKDKTLFLPFSYPSGSFFVWARAR